MNNDFTEPSNTAQKISSSYLKLASCVSICFAGVVIYSTGFGLFYPIEQSGGIYIASIFIVLCKLGSERILKTSPHRMLGLPYLWDIFLLSAAVFAIYRFMVVQKIMSNDLYDILNIDILACFLGLIVIVELTRRVWGWTLFTVTVCSILYILWGQDLPGVLRHSGFSFEQ